MIKKQKLPNSQFIPLSQFLLLSSLSYVTYRRLRMAGRTPQEYKLSGKTILIKETDAAKWLSKPPALVKPAQRKKA